MYHDFLGREIEDLEGENMRSDRQEEHQERKDLHWLAVGHVSPSVMQTVLEQGGRVDEISHDPPFLAVGLPHNPEGYWSWSKGRRQHRDSIEFWNYSEIQMEHMTLQWGPRDPQYWPVNKTYLIQPWEEMDEKTGKVKEPEEEKAAPVATAGPVSDDFDPFLDPDDLP